MAVKSRQRGKGGAAPGAPRPKIEPRKPPLFSRRWFRRSFVIVLVLGAAWIGTTIWGRVSRADSLRTYAKALFNAQRPYLQDTDASSQDSINNVAQRFAQKDPSVTAAKLGTAAQKWELDLTDARDSVRRLKPPSELKDANKMIAQAIDLYVGVARFYVVVQKQQELAATEPTKKLKDSAANQVQLLLTHISELTTRADTLYQAGMSEVTELERAWGVKLGSQPSTIQTGAPGTIPS
jgi:hypothetical protein